MHDNKNLQERSMKNSLFGKVFVQLPTKQVGISSYHFDSIDNSYIRFDGWKDKRFPFSKKFENAKFDGKIGFLLALSTGVKRGGWMVITTGST
jgi:hypothetical protein